MTSEALSLRSLQRLQIDLHAAAVQRGVRAVNSDERRKAIHRRILQDHVRQRLLAIGHRREGNALRGFGNAENHAGILHREKSFGHDRCKEDWSDQRADRDQQRGGLDNAEQMQACGRKTR